jgi:hypothetical protein
MRTDCAEFHDLKLDDAGELSEALARNGKALFLNVHRQMLQVLLREMSANKNGWYLWNALPALSAANGVIVQTVADLGSVQRKVLLRNAHGTAVRMTPVDAPIGVVGASPSGRLLLAVSRVPQPHAICYEVVQ